MYNHFLVPLDESEVAEAALIHAEGLAKALGARLTLIAVMSLDTGMGEDPGAAVAMEARRADLRRYLDSRCARLEGEGVSCHPSVREGDVAEEIARYAEKHEVDLIVMGTHGRTGLARWVHGSVSDRLLNLSDIPILIVRDAGD